MVRSESKAAYWSFTSASMLLSFIEKPKSKLLSHCEIVPAGLRGRDVKSAYRTYKSGGWISLQIYKGKKREHSSVTVRLKKATKGKEMSVFYEYRYIYSFTYTQAAKLHALSPRFNPIQFPPKLNTLLFDKMDMNHSFSLERILS